MSDDQTNRRYYNYSSSIDAATEEVLHDLFGLDLEHEVELINLEKNEPDQQLKQYIEGELRASHREKRQPYIDVLNSLRRQQYHQCLDT